MPALRVREQAHARSSCHDGTAAYFRYLTADPRRARIYTIEAVGMHSELEQHRRTKREAFVRKLTKATDRLVRPGRRTAGC